MPSVRLEDDATMHYADDDFADPWLPHETVVLVHGFAESDAAWFAWVPPLGRRFRVIRPDLRGFGRSTVPADPASYPWSPANFARDLVTLLDGLELPAAHIVGSRVGSAVSLQLAAEHPDRVLTLSLVSGLARSGHLRGLTSADGSRIPLNDFSDHIRRGGAAAWMANTGRSRLGSGVSDAQLDWWNALMSQSDDGVCAAVIAAATQIDLIESLPRITAPTLVLASAESQAQTVEATREWQERIAGSELQVLDGDSPHLAAERPEDCAARVLDFIGRRHPT